jgi:hypothetical protein
VNPSGMFRRSIFSDLNYVYNLLSIVLQVAYPYLPTFLYAQKMLSMTPNLRT